MATWAGVWNSSGTAIAELGEGVNIYYDKRFLKRALSAIRLVPFGQKRDIPKGAGDSIQFFRYNEISPSITASFLTDGTNPSPTGITGQDISATIDEWGNFSQHSRLLSDVHIDRKLAGITSLWGEHAGRTIDLLTQMAVCTQGAHPYNTDGENSNGDYFQSGTLTSVTSTTEVRSAEVAANTNFGGANDDLNQAVIIITSGTGYGQMRVITDYVATAGVITVAPAFDKLPVAGDGFVCISPHGITSSDVMTTAHVRGAVTLLRNNKATPMDDGYFVGILSPTTEAGLMADTSWTNTMQYGGSGHGNKTEGLFNGEVGRWGGVRWIRTTEPFRFPITTVGTDSITSGVGEFNSGTKYTNYTATGAIYSNLILGQEAFGVTTLRGNDVMKPGIIIKRPGPGDTGNPLNMFNTVGWYLPFKAIGLNPMFAVQMWSGG